MSATDMLFHQSSTCVTFSTSLDKLDVLLCGGITTGEWTEIVGEPATGKSQLCLSLAANVIGGENAGNSTVVYIDTSNSFSPSRLLQILVKKHQKTESAGIALLGRILCFKVFNVFSLFNILEHLSNGLQSQKSFHRRMRFSRVWV